MGFSYNLVSRHSHHHLAISFFILLISTSSQFRFFNVEGRKLPQPDDNSKVSTPDDNAKISRPNDNSEAVNEDKTMWSNQIGSRPPRCERRCGGCAHCEAIQVPTNPQTSAGVANSGISAAARGDDDSSNYKPMSWKCKCGNIIFNP